MEHGLVVRYWVRCGVLALLGVFVFFAVWGDGARGGAATGEAIGGIGAWRIGSADLGIPESQQLLGRYSVVVINAYEASLVSVIKAESPGTRVLMYTSAVDVDQNCDTAGEESTCETGITMYDVNSNDSTWVLRDASGNRIVNLHYPNYYVGDIGSSTYRSKWISHVTSQAKSLGFDGVSIDGVLGAFEGETGGVVPAKYPTDSAWSTAMAGFVDAVGPALKAQGLYVAAEVYASTTGAGNNDGSFDGTWWQRVAPDLSALFCEYFEQNPNNWSQMYDNTHLDWTDNWDGWLKLVDIAQNAGADFFGLDYASGTSADTRNMTYAKASFLLKWNGKGGVYFFDYRDGTAHNVWDPNWTMDIGQPSGAMYAVGSGAFRRDYGAGTVIVNPTQSTQTFSLGGSYTTPTGSTVTSVTLPPTSAAILASSSSSGQSTGSIQSIADGSTISGKVAWTVTPTAPTTNVSFYIDGVLRDTDGHSPFVYAEAYGGYLDTTTLSNGTHVFRVDVLNGDGTTTSAQATATVSNSGQSTGSAPGNTSAPVVSGTAQVGSQLAGTAGSWSGSPTSYAFAWLRCDSSGNSCGAISGQTSSTYMLTSADQGATIRATVTATNAYGSTTANSAQTGVVQAAGVAPGNTSAPVVSGTAQVGSQLTGTAGSWSGSPTSHAFAWLRCDSSGNSCGAISGQTSSTYMLTSADQGATIRATVTATNAYGSTTANSAQTGVVQAAGVAPGNTSAPVVSGTAQVGSQLTGTAGSWSGSPTSYAFAWLRCDSSGNSCGTISGQTSSTYMLTSADQGATIRASVTATNAYGSSTAVSNQTAQATAAIVTAPVNTGLPVISGSARVGRALTASKGSWTGSPTGFAYQWNRCAAKGANCVAIAGAAGTSYTLTTSDVNLTLRVTVTATNAGGSTSATSSQTAAVKGH